ncbi:MAG TPA: hypothetical protein VEQ15_05130 [Myxococcales bacterium]|nr:hypothetical protein [Myxococcales bacterium]
MARAPETGFYFEPMTERLVLVVEGAPFPTDDHWAYVGDPIEMTPEVARLECANRWPGVDPETLEVEFDLDFERAVEEAERRQAEDAAGLVRRATELDLDLDLLFAHAEALRHAPTEPAPEATRAALEEAAEKLDAADTIGAAIARAAKNQD